MKKKFTQDYSEDQVEYAIAEMVKFYEGRITHLESMLDKSMDMNRRLVEKIGSPSRDDYED
jgi:hypothetical protein